MFIKTKALFLILKKHLLSKWGRVLLAQAGIMIGVWAISLTSSLSLGLSDKIVTAINSQPSSREIQIQKLFGDKTNFFELSGPPKFVMIGKKDFDKIKQEVPNIKAITPTFMVPSFVKTAKASTDYNCVETSRKIAQQTKIQQLQSLTGDSGNTEGINPDISQSQKTLDENCGTITLESSSYSSYFSNNKSKLIGKTEQPSVGEISVCYKCGDLNLGDKLGAKNPNELLGKTLVLDFKQTPNYKIVGESYDTNERKPINKDLEKSNAIALKIVSVVDDSKTNSNILLGGGVTASWVDFSYYENTIKAADPGFDISNVGYISANAEIDSYDSLDQSIKKLQDLKYTPFSGAQLLIGGVKTLFTVLTYFLAAFGLIVLISAIFGIVNVMTISVLERRKEIGIIKSLGGNDGDIFVVFLLESIFLGVVGWLFGILLALGTGNIISTIVIALINSNAEWKENLAQFNINEFTPAFPWQLLAITFGLAVFFTSISGLIPSVRAAKQNIVEVLRSE
jgi:ABC-type antimicrobial peptide transport system permease subunit